MMMFFIRKAPRRDDGKLFHFRRASSRMSGLFAINLFGRRIGFVTDRLPL